MMVGSDADTKALISQCCAARPKPKAVPFVQSFPQPVQLRPKAPQFNRGKAHSVLQSEFGDQ
jgi:hypothetical protein